MKMRNYILPALLISAIASIVMAETIPLPDWAGTTGSPTGSIQALAYINSVKDLLETEAQDELTAAESPEAKLAVVYRESIKSRLYKAETSSDTYALMKALAEIQRLLEIYKSQWEYLYQGDTTWELDLTDSNSVGRVMAQLKKLKELQTRLDDHNDILNGLTNYNSIFEIPGGAILSYNEMVNCVWTGRKERGDNLMAFLLQVCNKNGFVKGNTYFFKGKTLRMWHADYTNAVKCNLQVHKYPACLVYTAWSYFEVGQTLESFRHFDEALAMYAVEVPNIDMTDVNHMRHLQSANACINNGDYTNAVRHLQASIFNKNEHRGAIESCLERIPGNIEVLWEYAKEHPLATGEIYEVLRKGYHSTTNIWCGDMIREALEHDWPQPSEIPVQIMNDRLLNNNIFIYKKRDIK